ncbi:hypothetical protein KATP_12920 [Kluyvera ascorbata]|nr:hypothetical protein KATP_12920 [Kluyvera ascorbata]
MRLCEVSSTFKMQKTEDWTVCYYSYFSDTVKNEKERRVDQKTAERVGKTYCCGPGKRFHQRTIA